MQLLETIRQWATELDWFRVIPEILGKALGILLGFAVSWYVLFRRRMRALDRLRSGDSDDILFQAHHLISSSDSNEDGVTLIFRNVASSVTVNRLFDNEAARALVQKLASSTTLSEPILATEGQEGFEVLNDAFVYLSGSLAVSPFEREVWLFAMTCEDRQVVRRKCIRCFIIREPDLLRFLDWGWARTNVKVERPWHWFRVVALHFMAKRWDTQRRVPIEESVPTVDRQQAHARIRPISLGICPDEKPLGGSLLVDWDSHERELRELGVHVGVPVNSVDADTFAPSSG